MRFVFTIILSVVVLCTSAQDPGSVVAAKFDAWQQQHQQFRTILVFSQDKYAPGDTAFFNAWFLTEDGRYVGDQQILNLDMIDASGKVVQHILFRVHDGVGANQLIIDPATTPGIYVMAAYNECMKNSDPRYAFRKRIVVVKHNAINVKENTKAQTKNDVCKIRIASSDKDNLTCFVSFRDRPEETDGNLVLALTAQGQLFYTATFKRGNKDSLAVKLPRKDVPAGLTLLTVLNNGSAIGSLHFYNPPASPFNVSIKTLHDTVSTRQHVTAAVEITDATGKPVQGQFAITVSNENLTEPFEDEINVASQQADDRRLSLEPSIVPWNEVMAGTARPGVKPPRLITRHAEVYFEDTKQFVPSGTIVNCFMKRSRFGFEDAVLDNGKVELTFFDFFGRDEMFYYAEHEGNELKNVRIRWLDADFPHDPAPVFTEAGRPDTYARYMEKKNIVDRSFNFFSSLKETADVATALPLEKEFENFGTVINFQDYKVFPTMAETVREFIPRLSYRRAGGKDIVKVNLSEIGLKAVGGPLYIIDGAMTKSTDYFLSLLTEDVISVRVVYDSPELQRFMPVSRNGIVVVKTKKGLAGNAVSKRSWLPIDGLNPPIDFIQPSGLVSTAQKPEFRSTIFWQPSVKTDSNGKTTFSFLTTDDTGRIRIKIRGVVRGQFFSAYRDLFVVFAD